MVEGTPRQSVLIIDDDPMILATFRRLTRDIDAKVVLVADLRAAWDAVKASVPDLVIADYRLQDGDGLSFLEKVQAKWPSVRCVLFTGEAVARTSVGLDIPVLGKPCPPETLRDLIIGALQDLARKT